jgi:hypothetical protein
MKRFCLCLLLLATGQPAWADNHAPYYGPMKRWHGIGYKFGYEDRIEKDGSWRIETTIHGGGEAIDMALYRAAERARDEGYRYVFFLGGRGWKSHGIETATLYARPSHEATPPTGCRSKKVTTCYTADVAEVLRILGGPGGTQPGVAIVDHRDEFGREVFLSGYGTGGVATVVPGGHVRSHVTTIVENPSKPDRVAISPVVRTSPPVNVTTTWGASVPTPTFTRYSVRQDSATLTAEARFERALKANQPLRGRDPISGVTVSD